MKTIIELKRGRADQTISTEKDILLNGLNCMEKIANDTLKLLK